MLSAPTLSHRTQATTYAVLFAVAGGLDAANG